MPYYADLNPAGRLHPVRATDEAARKRAIPTLRRRRRALAPTRPAAELQEAGVPPARDLRSLLLGTWNIRELDSATWGARLPETYAYIAEIIDRFDLVAVAGGRSALGGAGGGRRRPRAP